MLAQFPFQGPLPLHRTLLNTNQLCKHHILPRQNFYFLAHKEKVLGRQCVTAAPGDNCHKNIYLTGSWEMSLLLSLFLFIICTEIVPNSCLSWIRIALCTYITKKGPWQKVLTIVGSDPRPMEFGGKLPIDLSAIWTNSFMDKGGEIKMKLFSSVAAWGYIWSQIIQQMLEV